jgi:hypothetical protein
MSRPEEEYRQFVGCRAASLHRTAYLLCGDWHLASEREAAAVMRCSEGTVKSQTSRALHALGGCLKHKESPR